MSQIAPPSRFKVLRSRSTPRVCPKTIPWALIEPHRRQARINHYQTLERLNERGGLSPEELYAVLNDRPYTVVGELHAIRYLLGRLVDAQCEGLE